MDAKTYEKGPKGPQDATKTVRIPRYRQIWHNAIVDECNKQRSEGLEEKDLGVITTCGSPFVVGLSHIVNQGQQFRIVRTFCAGEPRYKIEHVYGTDSMGQRIWRTIRIKGGDYNRQKFSDWLGELLDPELFEEIEVDDRWGP